MITRSETYDFVKESNLIEGIKRRPLHVEIEAHEALWDEPYLKVEHVEHFVWVVANKPMRRRSDQIVTVAGHWPPIGGMHIEAELKDLLYRICFDTVLTPYEAHCEYEKLHPFMDGNGRSGRAVWAWHMSYQGLDPFALPFLHRFYYQTLSAYRQ